MVRQPQWSPPRTPFRWADVAPLGVSRSQLRDARAAGRITRLTHGVHVAVEAYPDDPVARHLMHATAIQMLHPTSIASHHTAALAWELALDDANAAANRPPAFIEPPGPTARSQDRAGFHLSVAPLPPGHRVAHPSGLNVTSPARSAVDVAAGLDLPEALITLDAAARRALIESDGTSDLRTRYLRDRSLDAARRPLQEAAAVAANQFTRGRLTTSVALADPRRESPLESLSFGHMAVTGLPLPRLQARIPLGSSNAYVDFLWAEQMVIGEADGMLKYQTEETLRAEKYRQEQLEQLGFQVVRWGYRDIEVRPTEVMHRILRALESRSRHPW